MSKVIGEEQSRRQVRRTRGLPLGRRPRKSSSTRSEENERGNNVSGFPPERLSFLLPLPHSVLSSCGDICSPATPTYLLFVPYCVHGIRRLRTRFEGAPAIVAVKVPIRLINVATAIALTLETHVYNEFIFVLPRCLRR